MIDRYTGNHSYVSEAKIVDIEKRYRPGPKHYVYVIQVKWSNPTNTFIIYRRYAQFFELQCKLLDLFAEAPSPSNNFNTKSRLIPFLPGKIFLGRSQIRQVALERKDALNTYIQTLISLPERISRSRCVLEFFQPLSTDVQNPIGSPAVDKKVTTQKAMVISEPAKLRTYRCIENFVAVEKTEMSLQRNTFVQVIHKHLNGWWFVQNGDRTGFVPGAFLIPTEQSRDPFERNSLLNTSGETYVVNKSYQAKNRDEISLEQGSFVSVIEKSFTGWWTVNFNNRTGQFPAIYLTSCKGRTVPTKITQEESAASSSRLIQRISHLQNYEHHDNNQHQHFNQPEIFYVHSDFTDEVGDCVSLQRGDLVEIHEKHSSGWWLGRRLKDDYVLTWLPSAFLQKEPIMDSYMDSSHLYLRTAVEQTQPQPDDNIYQNIDSHIFKNVTTSREIINKQQQQQPPVISQTHVPSNDNEDNSVKVSVKDLVKRFNRQ